MKTIFTLDNRVKATTVAFILTGAIILLEHFKGGVVSHHLLANEELPEISNWWGLLTVPILTWVVYSLIMSKNTFNPQTNQTLDKHDRKTLSGFVSALIFGVSASLLWELGFGEVLQYFILLPLLISFFKPVHLPEFLLGFVIGMIYTFGGVLPMIIGLVLVIICFLINKITYLFIAFLYKSQKV